MIRMALGVEVEFARVDVEKPFELIEQLEDQLLQSPIAGGIGNWHVEIAVRRNELVEICTGSPVVAGVGELGQPIELVRGYSLARHLAASALDDGPDVEQLVHVGDGERHDLIAATRKGLDESFHPQPAQRRPYRSLAARHAA